MIIVGAKDSRSFISGVCWCDPCDDAASQNKRQDNPKEQAGEDGCVMAHFIR
jgi:hypothetical protein